ncbi:hypothetical protein Ddye_026065 [Dipteronia dyeriana]|uniref:UDP-glycosyltransferase n=1 Tax=Dipteronia dyeriana TaxID=168575 RepID=A0AAD9TLG3_9ROSI|nr:hypothetical protein Ddye_026065 [Dipteronia dyeriana]
MERAWMDRPARHAKDGSHPWTVLGLRSMHTLSARPNMFGRRAMPNSRPDGPAQQLDCWRDPEPSEVPISGGNMGRAWHARPGWPVKDIGLCHVWPPLPWPSTGHINPMMNLCKLLASKKPDLLITIVTEETRTSSSSSSGTANFPPNIRFSYLPNNILPSVESRTADVFSLGKAIMTKLGAPFDQILDSFTQTTHPVTTILTDFSLSWAVHAGAHRNIPVSGLWPTTITEFSMHCHANLFKEKLFPTDLEGQILLSSACERYRVSDLPRFFLENGQSLAIDAWNLELPISKIQYLVCPSVDEIESQVFDFLRQKFNFPIYPCGPLIPYFDQPSTETPHDYVEWLNAQPTNSVLYVSMGSSYSLSTAQTDEMAAGLIRENSFRLKEACSGHELGLVVPWCDQMRVLGDF